MRVEIELCPEISSLPKIVLYEEKETRFLVYRRENKIPGRSSYKKRDHSANHYWVFEISADDSNSFTLQGVIQKKRSLKNSNLSCRFPF